MALIRVSKQVYDELKSKKGELSFSSYIWLLTGVQTERESTDILKLETQKLKSRIEKIERLIESRSAY